MFDFGNANEAQREAIQATDGPLLIIAGPGTGKTYTLVQRALYLIQEKGIQPENLFIATFTEKAAKELVTRITDEMAKRGIMANLNEMYVGTFHSLCLRILKDNLEYTRLKKNYRTLDTFDQQYTIFQNIYRFRELPHFYELITAKTAWGQSKSICDYANKFTEELVEAEILKADKDPSVQAMGHILSLYQQILADNNLMDYSAMQVETYQLLESHPEILKNLHEQITHFMVDEYQDTNYIQEQLVFLLAGKQQNICVVGDDDQGLYRFRGATIRNILEFPDNIDKERFKFVKLVTNYRSNSNIVDFYNKWMKQTKWPGGSFDWKQFRYDKVIVPHKKSTLNSPSVIKLCGKGDLSDWYEKILTFIRMMKATGQLTDYNQIAFLFRSVKDTRAQGLADYLESNGISVYSPRSNMFFQRDEVMLALGCLMLVFPNYLQHLDSKDCKYLQPKHRDFYHSCISKASNCIQKPEYAALKNWITLTGKRHTLLTGNTDYGYSGLIYQLFEFMPFMEYLDIDLTTGINDSRPARNLAMLSQMINRFEYINRISVLSANTYKGEKRIVYYTNLLFDLYLKLLIDEGIPEYEDDSEYAPSGCVSFLTIHQSKGMEFPIVFVDSLFSKPSSNDGNKFMRSIEQKYYRRKAYEPHDQTRFFDFWRLYYTAFSRAQDLLILSCLENEDAPQPFFKELYKELTPHDSYDFDLSEFEFHNVKDVRIKNTYSFTSHISVYETCALQYKFYKELGFMPIRAAAMLFGTLVHETIEDVHKAAMRHEEYLITPENVTSWFTANYENLSKAEHSYLDQPQRDAALRQVQRYVERQKGDWSVIQQAEVDVSLVKPDYIIEGKIDLIRGKGDTVEIVDFKSQKKPDLATHQEQLERYRRQLHIYSYLVEQRTGRKVSNMHLYYTADESDDPKVTFPYDKDAVDKTMSVFDDTVQKIMQKDFSTRCRDRKICAECDFRFYCKTR